MAIEYKWIALSNTTLGVFMATLDGSIVIVALPAIFRGIHLDPLAAGNVAYLLWLVLGYLVVSAVLVVSLGRLGDIYGRTKLYNLGFLIFSVASLALSLDPFTGHAGAMWLILLRLVQACGGAMISANSSAILTDAFPAHERGMALGINQMAALAGQFLGLLAGGLLALVDWRAVFWVNVPIGIIGTIWSYRSLQSTNSRRAEPIDWLGNAAFALGLAMILTSITYGIQPYHGHANGWESPKVAIAMIGGVALLVAFVFVEKRVAAPMFDLALFRIRALTAGCLSNVLASTARGGLQFVLVIWLQGIWLPLHGYSYSTTPLWAGVYLLPLTGGFLLAGPLCGRYSDRHGSRGLATTGLLLMVACFGAMTTVNVDFRYITFALLIAAIGIGQGMFSAPNTSAIMGSVPPENRGAASGMRVTFQNSGTALSIGVFFSLMTVGLSRSLGHSLTVGLGGQGVSPAVATRVAHLPPVSILFSVFLGKNPLEHVSSTGGDTTPPIPASLLSGRAFPQLMATSFHHGLVVVFIAAATLSALAALASVLRRPVTFRRAHVTQHRIDVQSQELL